MFEVDADKVDEVSQLITDAMQDVLTTTAVEKGWNVDFAVPLLVETDSGQNWDEAH